MFVTSDVGLGGFEPQASWSRTVYLQNKPKKTPDRASVVTQYTGMSGLLLQISDQNWFKRSGGRCMKHARNWMFTDSRRGLRRLFHWWHE